MHFLTPFLICSYRVALIAFSFIFIIILYTDMGFIAGSRDKFGDTFGRTTAEALATSYEYQGFRNQEDQREKRRQTAAGLGKDDTGAFFENNMTLARR